METFKLLIIFLIFQSLMSIPSIQSQILKNPPQEIPSRNSSLFRTYIGANFNGISFSDVPIHSEVEFHFILAFAVDYTNTSSPFPTNGNFEIFWDSNNLTPDEVVRIKNKHKNVKVALSIGGATVKNKNVFFQPASVDAWVSNAVISLTNIITDYNLDGIDIDYENFHAGPVIFAECIGQLVTKLKVNNVISMASIAPYDDHEVQRHYQALWKEYHDVFDYVNFQFYAYDKGTTVSQFLKHFDEQSENYNGGKVLASYATDGISGGLSPENGFFKACKKLKREGKLAGIFVWSADDSKAAGFPHDKRSQAILI